MALATYGIYRVRDSQEMVAIANPPNNKNIGDNIFVYGTCKKYESCDDALQEWKDHRESKNLPFIFNDEEITHLQNKCEIAYIYRSHLE